MAEGAGCGTRRYPAGRRARFRSAHRCGELILRIVSSIGFPTDRFGWPRPGGASCRIGAFRLQGRALRGFRINRLRYGARIRCLPKGDSAAIAGYRGRSLSAGRAGAERLGKVLRACGREAAAGRRERRDAMAVDPDQQHRRCDQYLPQNAGVSAASFVHGPDS